MTQPTRRALAIACVASLPLLSWASAVIKPEVDDMRDIYGAGVTAKSVLQDAARSTPMAVVAFPAALGRYSR